MTAAAVAVGIGAERRYGHRAGALSRAVLKLMLFGISPIVTFANIARLDFTGDIGLGIAAGWVALSCAGAVAYGVGRWGLRLDRPTTGTLMATSMQGNTGYLGLPLVITFLGAGALGEAVVYDQLVQTSFLLTVVFAVGAAMGTKAGDGLRERLIAFFRNNPPLLGVIVGLLAPASFAPDGLLDVSRVLVYTLVPLGFFAVGVTLASEGRVLPSRGPFPPVTRTVMCAIGLRLLVAPALLLVIAAPFIDLPDSYLLLAAMPAGVNGLVVAHVYGLDLGLAAATIAYSSVVVVVVAIAVAVIG